MYLALARIKSLSTYLLLSPGLIMQSASCNRGTLLPRTKTHYPFHGFYGHDIKQPTRFRARNSAVNSARVVKNANARENGEKKREDGEGGMVSLEGKRKTGEIV